jgi:ribosome-binding factor A
MAKLLLRHLTDPQLTMATISGVEVSPDLQHARVYVSRVGSAAEQQAAIMSLQHATGFMQGHLLQPVTGAEAQGNPRRGRG